MQADEKVQSHDEFKPFASGCRESSGKKLYGLSPKPSWVSDVACFLTDEGSLYLAGRKDLLTEEIAGYAMGERMTGNLVSQALFRAVAAKRPAAGFISIIPAGEAITAPLNTGSCLTGSGCEPR